SSRLRPLPLASDSGRRPRLLSARRPSVTCLRLVRATAWRTSSERVAGLVGSARVVKAANTLGAAVLGADPHEAGGQRVIFVSGDDVDAKSEVIALFQDAGFFAIDLGDLIRGGGMQQVRGPLAGVNLIRLP